MENVRITSYSASIFLIMLAGALYLSNVLYSDDIFKPVDFRSLIGAEAETILPTTTVGSELEELEKTFGVADSNHSNSGTTRITLPPTPLPTSAPERWKPECERWTSFRANIHKPKRMASSILSNPGPCNGECVAVCICGSLRTFFEPKVSNSIIDILINGFNPSGRTDVFMVTSEEHSAKGGVYVIPEKDQCSIWGRMNLVAVEYVQAGDGPKTDRCRALITETERKHNRQYDWIIRPRPDSYWKTVSIQAKTAQKVVYYRHNQFTMLPRQYLHNFKWPFRGTPEHEIDVNEQPVPKLEFYIWRTSKVLGLKFRYYESTCMYMVPNMCGPCGRGNRDQVGPAFKLINKAKAQRDASAVKRLRQCMHGMFSVACHQLRHHFKSIEPPPRNTPVDVKAIMQTLGDLAEKEVNDNPSLDNLGRMLDHAQDFLRRELMVPDDNPQGWMPSLQRACSIECNPNYNYTTGPWTWGCLSTAQKNSLAMKWHPPGFAEAEAGAYGEC